MTEHHLTEITKEEGSKETRFHYVCSCGQIGPDHGIPAPQPEHSGAIFRANVIVAEQRCERDHKIHAEGGDATEAADHQANPEGVPWSERIERERR